MLPNSLSRDLKPNKDERAVLEAVVVFVFLFVFVFVFAAFLIERLEKSTGAGSGASMGMDCKRTGEPGGELASCVGKCDQIVMKMQAASYVN